MADPKEHSEQGKFAFSEKKFNKAAELFEQAADGYLRMGDLESAAEMQNNRSVSLLKVGKAQQALEAALGTEATFANSGNILYQAMALGNQASALDELKRYDEAIEKFEAAAMLFEEIGKPELRSMVMKSAAASKFKAGKISMAAYKMLDAMEATENPTLGENIFRFFGRLFFRR